MLLNARMARRFFSKQYIPAVRSTYFQEKSSLVLAQLRYAHGGNDIHDPRNYPPGLHPGHMDEMPVPRGDWKESYEKYQKKYNRQLAFGLAFLAGTCYAIYEYELIDFVLAPPMKNPKPDPISKSKAAKGTTLSSGRPLDIKPIEHLPESIPYLIVGGGAAAFAAFRSIRSNNPKAKVLVVAEEDRLPYMRPPLSKELWFSDPEYAKRLAFRQWNGSERSVTFEKEEFYCPLKDIANKETGGVALLKGHKIVKVDPAGHKAYVDNGQIVTYEKCLVATGGTPRSLPVFDQASPEVRSKLIYYRAADDYLKLYDIMNTAKSITIVGGGFLGSELACALGRRSSLLKQKIAINQVFSEPGNLSNVLPEYLSKWTLDRVRGEGVNVVSGTKVTSAEATRNGVSLNLSDGSKLESDYVIVAVGISPNTELASTSGLETNETQGGFLVNAELEARTDVWVAGDASNFYDVKFGRRRVEHHDHAIISGRLAGENMTGAKKPYTHQSMFWSDLGPEIGFEAVGLIDSSFPTVGVFAKSSGEDSPEKSSSAKSEPKTPGTGENYEKGVVFYLRDRVIVGIVLWNVFNKMNFARRMLAEGKVYEDLNEVAKLFNIHAEEE